MDDNQTKKFKKIWKAEYDQDLTNSQAKEYSDNLLGFLKILIEIDSNK